MQSNTNSSVVDIVVVGAGMVGLSAALALHNSGFKVTVIEGRDKSILTLPEQLASVCDSRTKKSSDDLSSFDNRVSALTRASENILRNLNAWPTIEQMRLCAYRQMCVWDGDGTGNIDFSSAQLHQPNLGHIVENSVVLAGLITAANEVGLTIICSAKVTDMSEPVAGLRQLSYEMQSEDAAIANNKSYINARLIIGADGALSKVRQLAAIPLWQWDYGHHALVATVKTQQPHQDTAWQRFTSDGPLAFLPLSEPHISSIVFSTSPGHAKMLMELADEEFNKVLSQEFEQRLGTVVAVSKRAVFPLRQRHAKYYVQQGLALIGDAIHTIHPLAGQGVNLGLLDVASLVQVLCVAKARGQDIDEEALLKQFQRERHSDNLKMSATMQAFKWLFDPQSTPLIIARNMGMSLLNKATPVKGHIMAQAMGLSDNLPPLATADYK